jgi:hypothetical protein
MKAFDKVPHLRLIHKLEKYQITGQFSGWIRSFLLGRKQRVIVNGDKRLAAGPNIRRPITVTVLGHLLQALAHVTKAYYQRIMFETMFLLAF